MKYRKFKADYLFNNAEILNEDHILIADLKGKIIDIVSESTAGEEVEVFKGILCPGFINTHCHLELSHLKNKVEQKTGLVNFVVSVVSGRHFPEVEILKAIETAEVSMFKEGIVAVGDICNNTLTLLQKEKKNLAYHNFIEVSGWNPEVAESRFGKSKFYYDEFTGKGFNTSMAPHASYSVSEALWGKIAPFFSGKVTTIHNQETKDEDQFFLDGSGDFRKMYQMMKIDNSFFSPNQLRSVANYFMNLFTASSIILVHNTFTKQEDIDYIYQHKAKNQSVSFCLCPNANIFIEDTLPPVELLIKNKCNIAIGTDSLASNAQLSVIAELKTIVKNFPDIPTEMLLQWATINGAKALQMDNTLGSFEKGKIPGIVLLENIIDKKITPDSKARRIL